MLEPAKLCALFLACHLTSTEEQLQRMVVPKQSQADDDPQKSPSTGRLLCAETCGEWRFRSLLAGGGGSKPPKGGAAFVPFAEEQPEQPAQQQCSTAATAEWMAFCDASLPMSEWVSWVTVLSCLHMPVDTEKDTLHSNVRLPLLRSFVKQTKCRAETLGVHHTEELCKLFLVKGLGGDRVLRRVAQQITSGGLELAEWVSQPIVQISDRVYRSVDADTAMLSECCMLTGLLRVSRHGSSSLLCRVYDVPLRAAQRARLAVATKESRNECVVRTATAVAATAGEGGDTAAAAAGSSSWTVFLQTCVARKFATNLSLLLYCCAHIEHDLVADRCLRRYSTQEEDEEDYRVCSIVRFRERSPRIDSGRWAIVCRRLGKFEYVNNTSSKSYRNTKHWLATLPVLVHFHAACNDDVTEEATMLAYFCLYQKEWRQLWTEATNDHAYALPYLSEDLEDILLSHKRTKQLDLYTMDRIQNCLVAVGR